MDLRVTRRELVGAGTAAALGAAFGAAPAVGAGGDRELLLRALDVERLVAWGYERVLSRGTLTEAARGVVARLLGHVQGHVSIVARALGEAPGLPLSDAAAIAALDKHQVPASPTDLHTLHHSLRLLVDLESVAEGAWFRAIAGLQDPGMVQIGAAIMAAEAQHWTVLSAIAHPGMMNISVPYPFVRGTQ